MKKKTDWKEIFTRSISFKDNKGLQKFILVIGLFAAIYLLLAFVSMPARLDINIGRPSPQTIFAPRDAVDEYATEERRQSAAESVAEVYDYDPDVLDRALAEIGAFFDEVIDITEDQELEREEKLEILTSLVGRDLPSPAVAALLADTDTLRDLQERINNSVRDIFEQGIKENEEVLARRRLNQEIALYPVSADLKRVAEMLVEPLVEQNMYYNALATEENRELARRQVEPVIVFRNTLIVSEGEPVTEHQYDLLEDLGLIRGQQADYPAYIGLFLLLAVVFILVGGYIYIFVNDVFNSPALLLLMGLVFFVTLVFSVAASYFSGFFIPVAMGVILITVLFGYKLALINNFALALMVGLITGGEFSYILVALMGGLVSIYAVTRLSQRSDLARAGFYVSATNLVLILAVYLFFGNVSMETDSLINFSYSAIAGVGNGIFSAVVAIGLLPFLESLFGVTTAITLLELSNPNHPLLREMLLKAPGTYYHSMMVSNLAEAAADRLKANSLLTRVGAYYHDIGKLKRPYFFSENQLSGENPHEKLSPNLSALIIGAHPKDGLEMGRKHRLPEPVIEIAAQHHGTSMISFFYQQAVEQNGTDKVEAEKFRYEGPKPQTKEAAIIMLADTVEAGVRSLTKPTSNRVEMMVRRMIKEKLEDGQLDQSDLTLKELDVIADAFIYIMSGIYHSRIEYPEKELKAEIERSSAAK
ncbi:MAG TPA: HDIG domain-containing protein [Firmicutes bacterium]|nr:HDIG domain-containing protein [Bacillota bacterium]